MDGHQPDYVRIFVKSIRFTVIDLQLPQTVNIAEKLEETGEFRPGKSVCLTLKHTEICGPLCSAGQRGAIILVSGFFQKPVDYFGYRAILYLCPPLAQKSEKIQTLAL